MDQPQSAPAKSPIYTAHTRILCFYAFYFSSPEAEPKFITLSPENVYLDNRGLGAEISTNGEKWGGAEPELGEIIGGQDQKFFFQDRGANAFALAIRGVL